MLYKFKSPATGDIIMLEPNGRRVLQIIGKDVEAAGIILPEHMAVAIAALTSAVTRDDAERKDAVDQAKAKGETLPNLDAVSLRKRAWPMVEMLQRCAKENAPVTWGV